ncbi:MAG: alpha/beta hydrolase [Anaeromyxobacteraceae bacterium]
MSPRRVEVQGASIAVEVAGSGDPVLLLHGFPATGRLWSGVTPALAAAGFTAVVPDLVGYGASSAPEGLRIDMASQATWLLGLLDALGFDRAAVVAHDVGTAAAQLLVTRAAPRVRGLVLMDGVLGANWAMEAITGIQAWDPADAHRLPPVLLRRLGKTAVMREVLSAYRGAEGGLQLIRAARDLEPAQTADLHDVLRSCGVPALVLWGERDAYFPVERVARPLAQLLSAPLRLVPGAHFSPADCPAEVAAALVEFLRGLPREPGQAP